MSYTVTRYSRHGRRQYTKRGRKPTPYVYSSMAIPSSEGPMPKKFRTKMKYCASDSLDPGLGALAYNSYRANSLYDPDAQVGGHQPLGFDQIMPFYKQFTVLGSKITVQFINPNNTGLASIGNAIVNLNTNAAPTLTLETIREQANTTYKPLLSLNSSRSVVTLKKRYSAKKYLGVKDPVDDDEQSGTASADPAQDVYFHVMYEPVDASQNLDEIWYNIHIEYDVVFHDRIDLGQS